MQNYFPTWAFVIPTSLTRIPASLLETLFYTVIAVSPVTCVECHGMTPPAALSHSCISAHMLHLTARVLLACSLAAQQCC